MAATGADGQQDTEPPPNHRQQKNHACAVQQSLFFLFTNDVQLAMEWHLQVAARRC